MQIATTFDALQEICSKIDEQRRFAIDLEFIPERTYQPVLCLVQLATVGEAFIIDPLAIKDLSLLWQRVAHPEIETVLHAAGQDLELIFSASALVPQNIFDTQVAAGFAGFGYPIGYGKLLQQLLGISIAKSESFSDWLERPLSASQIEYAVEDVCHLLPMADKLIENLEQLERAEWAFEECRQLSDSNRYSLNPKSEFTRVKGANSLNRRGLGMLQVLCDLRSGLAKQLNRPTKSIISDTTLIELSRRPPKQIADIQRIRGIRTDQVRAHGKEILAAVERAWQISDADLPIWPASKVTAKRDLLIGDLLYSVLKVITHESDIATELVATRDEVQALVRQVREHKLDNSQLPLLQGWRKAMAGSKLVSLLTHETLSVRFQLQADPAVLLSFSNNATGHAEDQLLS
jgi:ribonuclease D